MFCKEICPIARRQREVVEGHYTLKGVYTVISIVVNGVTVAALENRDFPEVLSTVVPATASPTCNVPERVRRWTKPGASGATEDCPFVSGGRAWITVSR